MGLFLSLSVSRLRLFLDVLDFDDELPVVLTLAADIHDAVPVKLVIGTDNDTHRGGICRLCAIVIDAIRLALRRHFRSRSPFQGIVPLQNKKYFITFVVKRQAGANRFGFSGCNDIFLQNLPHPR